MQKTNDCKGGKKSKVRLTVAFFVAADGSFVSEPVVIWKSKTPRCLKNLKDKHRPSNVHYFSSKKAWMTTELMETILMRIDRKFQYEDRKVLLFLDNAPSHPETLQSKLRNIKLIYLPKRTTSRLQPLDAGIIRSFKPKYRKLLVKYVIARVDEGKKASDIIQDVDILKAIIHWLQLAWENVSKETIQHFQKCGFSQFSIDCDEDEVDEEFQSLFSQLSNDDEDITLEDYLTFDDNLSTSVGQINTDLVDWRETARESHSRCSK